MSRLAPHQRILFTALPLAALLGFSICTPASRQAILNSAILAAGACAIALPLGLLLALLIGRYDLPARRLAAAALGVLLFLPLYVQLCGWDAAFGKLGWFSLAYGSLAEPLLVGMRGAIAVHGFAAVPWAALIIGVGLAQIDPAQEEAALLVGPPRFAMARVTLPQSLPFLAAAAIWTIVSTTSDMTVTNIMLINAGERTYTEQFYMTFSLSADPGEATLSVLPGIAGLSLLVVASFWLITGSQAPAWEPTIPRLLPRSSRYWFPGSRLTTHYRTSRPLTFSAGSARPFLSILLWSIVIALVAVPIASLLAKAGFVVEHHGSERQPGWSLFACLREVALAPWRFRKEFGWTIIVATAAASLAWCVALPLGWQARRGSWHSLPATLATVLGLVIPGPLVGVGLIWLLNRDLPPEISLPGGASKSWLLVLYDQTPLAPILAQAIRALPLVTLLAWHSFRTLDPNVLAAAALDGASPWRVFTRIALPQRRRALAAAWLAGFAIAAGDLAWAHLVTPPGLDLLQRRVFGLVHSGVEEQVAAISLVNVLAYTLLAGTTIFLLKQKKSSAGPKLVL